MGEKDGGRAMKDERSKLLLATYDGSLRKIQIESDKKYSKVKCKVRYYDETADGAVVKAKIVFQHVVAIRFYVNQFENTIGAELGGFYEIFDGKKKKEMLEKNFAGRREGYLYHGNYQYDPEDGDDMLNYRDNLERAERKLDRYHLYQLQTVGGMYELLAKGYLLEKKKTRS